MLFRAILELIAVVLIITVLRSVIGIISKFFSTVADPRAAAPGRPPTVSTGGELKKDPVCGTFIASASALKKTVGGETYYFCSPDCRDKFK
jgi:YHS domain-containing protein